MGPCNWVLWEFPRVCSQIIMSKFFRKSIYCVLGGPKKVFLAPKPFLASETSLWGGGVNVLKLFNTSNGFKVIYFKIAIFLAKIALDISKTVAWIKKF